MNAPAQLAVGVPLLERIRRATLGRFDVMTAIGEGGMATVFLARDLALDRQVAIKVMNPSLMSSPAALGRFRREARIAAALDHPHIISIFAVGEDADLAFYVMRYIEGRSLHDVLREEGALTFRRTDSIVFEAGQALAYAHRRGVIHRDVKPANIMLDQDDWLVVTDFGIAKLDNHERITLSGHIFGTPHYMSPEYFNGGLTGSASDQYALGVVTYELLTGATPFPGDTIGEVMRGHLFDPIPPLRTIRPDLPEALEQCVHRMLSKEPAQRFPTVGDAVSAFRASGRSGESGAITERIDTDSRTPIVISRAVPARRRTLGWPLQLSVGLGAFAAVGAALIIGIDVLRASGANKSEDVPAQPAAITPTEDAGRRAPVGSGTATKEATKAAPAPAVTGPPPAPAVTGPPGTVRIGSNMPLTMLYVGRESPRLIGEAGLQTLSVAPGATRLSIRLDNCAAWDTTFTVKSGAAHTIGWRAPRC